MFDKINGWSINDGFYGKCSKNGTWVFIDHKFEIEEYELIKIGNNIISIKTL